MTDGIAFMRDDRTKNQERADEFLKRIENEGNEAELGRLESISGQPIKQ